jgi:hypothetical protein
MCQYVARIVAPNKLRSVALMSMVFSVILVAHAVKDFCPPPILSLTAVKYPSVSEWTIAYTCLDM